MCIYIYVWLCAGTCMAPSAPRMDDACVCVCNPPALQRTTDRNPPKRKHNKRVCVWVCVRVCMCVYVLHASSSTREVRCRATSTRTRPRDHGACNILYYIQTYTNLCTYIYIYIERERDIISSYHYYMLYVMSICVTSYKLHDPA